MGAAQQAVEALEVAPPGGWHPVDGARVGPPAWLQGGGDPRPGLMRRVLHRVLVWSMRALGRRQVPNVFLMLLRIPRVLVPWSWYASRLMPYGRLEPLWRERMILRIAWNCRCRYEWLQHLEIGYRVGLSPDDALRVTLGPAGEPDPRVASLLRACDEVHAERRVGDATYRELAAFLSEPLVLEVLFVIGHYESLAGVLNSTAIHPEEEVLDAVRGAPGATGDAGATSDRRMGHDGAPPAPSAR